MRLTLLIFILLFAGYTGSAQCNPQALKNQMKEAAKQMEGDSFLQYLQDLEEENETRRDYCNLAVIYERLGTYYYSREAGKSISYRHRSADNYLLANDKPRAIMSRQNIAFIYDEQKHDIPAAIRITEGAIKGWEELKDTLQLANMQKYYGYLLGKTGNYDEAVKQIENAIAGFQAMANKNGIAVSYYDMASVLFEQKKYLPAVVNLQVAKLHWTVARDTSRIVGINNFLLRTYLAAEDLQNATSVYNDNVQYIDKSNTHWKDKLNFLKYGAELFRRNAQLIEAEEVTAEYKALKDSLVQKGIKVD